MSSNILSFQPLHNPSPFSQTLENAISRLAYLSQSKQVQSNVDSLLYTLISEEEHRSTGKEFKKLKETEYEGLKFENGESLESLAIVKGLLNLIKPPAPEKKAPQLDEDGNPIEEEEEEPEEDSGPKPSLSPVLLEAQLARHFGLGLSHVEVGALHMALVRFSESKIGTKFSTIRFFGKLYGTLKNYYILECEAPINEDEEEPEEDEENAKPKPDPSIIPPEPQGKPGTNRYLYFVTNGLESGNWEQLPDVDPSHIKYSREIKLFITGVLDSPIESHPPFPGTEREYLRAQIARISAATTIAPKGFMKIFSEDEEEEDDDGPKKPKPEVVPIDAYKTLPTLQKNEKFDPRSLDLTLLTSWTHILPSILHEQNRAQLYRQTVDEEEEEEEEEDAPKKPKEPVEQILPLLAPLHKETPLSSSNTTLPGWKIQQSSVDSTLYLVSSLRWPGSHCVAKLDEEHNTVNFFNLYLGDGNKFVNDFTPTFVAPVEEEFYEYSLDEEVDPSPEKIAKFEVIPPKVIIPEETGEDTEENGEGEEQQGEGEEEQEDE